MKFLISLFLIVSCSNQTYSGKIHLPLNEEEKENLNRFLKTEKFELYEFGTVQLQIDQHDFPELKISEIYDYSYKSLKAKDGAPTPKKPTWLKDFNEQGGVFQEVFIKAQSHLNNISRVIRSAEKFTNVPGICCVTDKVHQLNQLNSQYKDELERFSPKSYKTSSQYLKANWYWAFKAN